MEDHEVARERGRESRHLGPRESTGKLLNLASSEAARAAKSRTRDKVVSAFRCFGYRKMEIRALGVASNEVTIGRRRDRAKTPDKEKSAS
jgi:hypothetical protein